MSPTYYGFPKFMFIDLPESRDLPDIFVVWKYAAQLLCKIKIHSTSNECSDFQ